MERPELLDLIQNQVLVFDGATGSNLQDRQLTLDDFEGAEGCNEVLARTRPDVVQDLHRSFLEVGCHVVETNSFGSNTVVLGEYDLADQTYDLNLRAAKLAREVARDFSSADRPRYVAGSIGPGTKLPSLGHISFDDLVDAFRPQVAGLAQGGADLMVVETCQDILQVRAAIRAVRLELAKLERRLPLMVSLTMETTGSMLLGTELGAALAALEPLRPDILGLNCATGPLEMKQHIQYLSRRSPFALAALPNAGLPENIGGQTVYSLTPEQLAEWQSGFVEQDGARVVGGCCGTTPAHIEAVVRAVDGLTPAPRQPRFEPAVSSLYSGVPLDQQPKPLLIGERTNANGSKKFRKLLLAENFEGMVELAKGQERGGAHALDLCVAYVGRDEMRDMSEAASRFTRQVRLPLVLDSTQPEVLEAALKLCGGRCMIDSVNLEDGEDKALLVMRLARDYGAALVALTIDEKGMARTVEDKLAVAKRLHQMAVEQVGLRPQDLIFDMLTFTVCSGDETLRDAAVQTLDAIRQVKQVLPGVSTILGLSNISFGLKPRARHPLNSVFLHQAVEAGLDMAIVEARKILPLSRIDETTFKLAEDLLLDRRVEGQQEPVFAYIEHYQTQAKKRKSGEDQEQDMSSLPERIQNKVVDGNATGMDLLLASALTRWQPLEIINQMLIPGMKQVGKLFGAGKMQLPFVLQSAEVMKRAVGFLEPVMEKEEGENQGVLVLATVKGDVHDIGKNLVDILLSNNGYRVINMGIKVNIEEMIRVWQEEKADAIGMSGLLVKSTMVMRENLEELRRRGLNPPVLLGGAALTRRYVEEDLRGVYGDGVHYGKDAFDGLNLMGQVMAGEAGGQAAEASDSTPQNIQDSLAGKLDQAFTLRAEPQGIDVVEPPTPPFWGTRVVDLPLEQVIGLINETALFRGRWQYRRGKLGADEFKQLIDGEVRPLYEALRRKVVDEELFQARGVYSYLPCHGHGNELVLLDPESRAETGRFAFPRQLKPPHHNIADYFRPAGGEPDMLGCMVVTIGPKATERTQQLFEGHRYRDYLHLHGLAVETADAAAELLHRTMRRELGIAGEDGETPLELAQQRYHGSRYSFGYPACPNLSDHQLMFRLMDPARIGVSLTESHQMVPEQSVSAIVVHHPAAKYFSVS